MTPTEAIDRLLLVPYAAGAGSWAGADCWGVVELWYGHVLGIALNDRLDLPPGNASVQQWADEEVGAGWERIATPVDNAIVLMRTGRLDAGHVGVFFQGNVIHSAAAHGCVLQPMHNRLILAKTTGFLQRNDHFNAAYGPGRGDHPEPDGPARPHH